MCKLLIFLNFLCTESYAIFLAKTQAKFVYTFAAKEKDLLSADPGRHRGRSQRSRALRLQVFPLPLLQIQPEQCGPSDLNLDFVSFT